MTSALKQTEPVSPQQQIDTLKQQMVQFRVKFIHETQLYVADWFETIADKFFNIDKSTTSSLSQTQKFELRDELQKAQNRAESRVAEMLDNTALWWDQDSNSSKDNDRYKSIEEFMPQEFRLILGGLGPVLVKYGYIERSKFGDRNFVSMPDGTGGHYYTFDGLYFPSDQMKRSFDKYWEWFKFAIRI